MVVSSFSPWCRLVFVVLSLSWTTRVEAQSAGSADIEYFETHIRPVLTAECLGCHNVKTRQGGLALDSRPGWLQGGDSGEVIVPGKPNESLLVDVLRHRIPGQEMPSKAPKLDDETIDRFASWIQNGAVDPRTEPQSLSTLVRPWPAVMAERTKWWCWQPLAQTSLQQHGSKAIDAWIQKKLDEEGIPVAEQAESEVLLRRLSYALRGLPPTSDELRMLKRSSLPPRIAWEQWVDTFLASTEFGEHWARHWMDIVRYSETHGSEDDAFLPFSFRYRDYLVRAFQDDVPFDQMIREQIAGDLIAPRWSKDHEYNEAILGTAFWRMVEFNQTPVDVKREEIIVIDSQIDSFSKVFQAMTLSCARCHDHKFDPISDEDYYSVYGILRSTRAGLRIIDEPTRFTKQNEELEGLATQVKNQVSQTWRFQLKRWEQDLKQSVTWLQENWREDAKPEQWDQLKPPNAWARQLLAALRQTQSNGLRPLASMLVAPRDKQPALWQSMRSSAKAEHAQRDKIPSRTQLLFDLTQGEFQGWRADGVGLPSGPIRQPGMWSIQGGRPNAFGGLLERGYHTNILSDRHGGTLRSPDFVVQGDVMSVLARGSGQARLRLVIENFQGDSLLFETINPELRSNELQWIRMTIRPQWRGLRAHLECLTRDDKPYVGIQKNPSQLEQTDGRSSFGIAKVVVHGHGESMPAVPTFPLEAFAPEDFEWKSFSQSLVTYTQMALDDWRDERANDEQVRWISFLMQQNLLTPANEMDDGTEILAAKFRSIEEQIPIARRSPGVFEDHCAVDQEFLNRGDHRQAQNAIARRYMEVLGSMPEQYMGKESGRLQLANELANPKNPLTARVYVNRVWHWLLGRGIVSTVDNFGRMGETPSHPELLDQLASEWMQEGWSTKQLIRKIVLSDAWQRSANPSPQSLEKDPENRWLSHASVRRLDAEAIRDTMVLLGSQLRKADSGRGTLNYYRSIMEANKQAPSGPLDGDHRRTLFLEVRRNFPNDFLSAFDFPKPSVIAGRRSTTVVPAQSLALLNDPFTLHQAKEWAKHLQGSFPDPELRLNEMFLALLGRDPNPQERQLAHNYLKSYPGDQSELAWAGLAHAMFNWKEAIYVR